MARWRNALLPAQHFRFLADGGQVSSVTRTLLLAAATLGVAEVALFRVASPVASHIPLDASAARLAQAVEVAGERAFMATTFMVVLGALAYLATTRWRGEVAPVLVAACLVTTLLVAWSGAPAARLAAHAMFAIAVAALAAAAVAGGGAYRLGVALAATGLLAGRLPLFLDSVASTWRGADPGLPVAAAASVAEAAFLLVPLALAVELLRRQSPPAGAWLVAGATSLLVAAALALSPSYTAIVSTWATGVTLSLPAPAYSISAGAAALVLAVWLVDRPSRLVAAGLVLLAVAGAQPAVVHHNVTALLGLVLLAAPAAIAVADGGGKQTAGSLATARRLQSAAGSLD